MPPTRRRSRNGETKVAAVVIGTDRDRFRSRDANKERLALAESIAEFALAKEIDLVLLPAGFLTSARPTPASVGDAAGRLARIFTHTDLLAGIDEPEGTGTKRAKPRTGKRALRTQPKPFWAFGARRGIVQAPIYRQRTAQPGETTTETGGRVLALGGKAVGLLICGEVYNAHLAEGLAAHRPDIVVDLGHLSMGRGFSRRLVKVASTVGCNVYHCQHVALASTPAKWMATPTVATRTKEVDWASYDEHWNGRDLWAEIKVWHL